MKASIAGLSGVLAMLLLMTGCTHQQGLTSAEKEMDKTIARESIQVNSSELPDAVSAALLTPTILAKGALTSQQGNRTARFDVAVNKMPAEEFFYGLTEGTDINIVVRPGVTGTISLQLSKVTLDEVLEVVRDVYGYEVKERSGIYSVYPRELRTQIFEVNYLDIKRVGVSETSVQIGKIEGSTRRGQNNSNTRARSGSLLGLLDEGAAKTSVASNPGTRITTLNKTDFWTDVRETIVAIIGGEREDRMVKVTPMAGIVVVRALPAELSAVREYLERSELSVRRQVMIEAKILEVRLNESFQAGINWAAISGQILRFENVSTFTSPNTINEATDNGFLVSSIISVQNISTLMSLLETQGSVQVLSSPRISTVNNQKAVIRVGSDEFFVTGVTDNTTSNASSTTSSPTIELDSFFSGIALDVTPQIAANGDVILHIHPVITEVTDQQKELVLGNETFSLPLALRNIRETDTIVLAKNGQVVVLGGLMLETVSEFDGKRPFLGSIPLLRNLFVTRESRKTKTELVILLQPIVMDDEAWGDSVYESRERIRTLGDEYRALFNR